MCVAIDVLPRYSFSSGQTKSHFTLKRQVVICIVMRCVCDKGGGVRDWTYQYLFHKSLELKVRQEKDRMERGSTGFSEKTSSSMPADIY